MFAEKLELAIVADTISVVFTPSPYWPKKCAPPPKKKEKTNLTTTDSFEDFYAIETENNSQKLFVYDNQDSLGFNNEIYYLCKTLDKSIKGTKSVIKRHNSNEIAIKLNQQETTVHCFNKSIKTVPLQVEY